MHTIESIYTSELNTKAQHVKSGSILYTDAPTDNLGKGENFSPTDLLAASLGSCMLTLMGIAAQSRSINIDGTKITITKIMGVQPRRVSEIIINIYLTNFDYNHKEKELIEYAAINCPVAKSLHPDLIQKINFIYKD